MRRRSGQTASGDERGTAGGAGNGTGPSADATDQAAAESADADGAASIDSQFEDLMKGIDIDEMAFGMAGRYRRRRRPGRYRRRGRRH